MERAPVKKTALVTGAEGFIGSHLVRFLRTKGWNVVGTYRTYGSRVQLDEANLSFAQCDLRNGQRVQQVFEDCRPTHVFHLGAQSLPTVSWSDPVETFESNIMGSLYLLETARHCAKPPVIVCACSSAEYGNVPQSAIPVTENHPPKPLHPYGISKLCVDLLARQYFVDYGLPIVTIRLFNTTGPGKTDDAPSDFVRQLARIQKGLQEPLVEVGNLRPYRAFLDVRDTVNGFYLAATKGERGETYNLCADRTYRISEVLRTAISLSGVQAKVLQADRLMRPSDEKVIFGNAKKFRAATGWKPICSLTETLQSMLEYWQRQS
ncbi:MAG TPA: GDP-mannose 4,6-dehydratase [Terracidiphilus sp.]